MLRSAESGAKDHEKEYKEVYMYIQSEKDLEDYICENIQDFKQFLSNEIFGNKEKTNKINFIGRQVNVGGKFIDLLFDYWDEVPDGPYTLETRTFVVVELKYRNLIPNDLAQLSRYMNLLNEFSPEDMDYEIAQAKGVLLGLGLDENMQEIEMCLSNALQGEEQNIFFGGINTNINFKSVNYSLTDEYIESLVFDNRLMDRKTDAE